ncbi:MAG: class I SAM-dependent DNA methyltransferase, partial [Rhodanobacteraceae bacterium]|nr:class I SAM-dependent DNA methyltransferase [Rhodanobacteraceae bacterium]
MPADEGRPPFVVVVDVGRSIELYSEFSRSGATYTPFPDPRSHRIRLDDLRDAEIRERLRALWLEPLSLDPTRRSARVTREIAAHLAELARSLERAGHAPQASAGFLTRCLFTLFAEDVELIPKNAFRDLLETLKDNTAQFQPMLGELWRAMDAGLFSVAIRADLLRFNGKLFKHPEVLPLDRAQIELLLKAAQADWHQVEPAIFGTLLERALDPDERHALGAHYTPRAYVERLVLPTVIEPLREDWNIAQAAALTLAAEGKADSALAEITAFHQRLCAVRVLDPACGSGNFLYVTLEHLKRLEGEVLNAFDELDPNRQAGKLRQAGLALDGDRADPFGGETVDPHQLLGIELNPRAAAIAELVLWIGYLQWHFRTRGKSLPPEPVLKDFRNIECRDAVLTWDEVSYATDERGVPLTRWDGKTLKASPVTGELIPDESARVPQERYANPRKAAWPQADFVIGNPPFIGTKRMKLALGDGYASALRMAWPDVPESSDFVMYWWHHAATLTARGALRRFGLITTSSLRQTFNRRVVEAALSPAVAVQATAGKRSVCATSAQQSTPTEGSTAKALGPGLRRDDSTRSAPPISLVFAIPDHPWVDAADGAAVRIAMTVGATGITQGRLLEVTAERPDENGEVAVDVRERGGVLHADLRMGANVASAKALQANEGLSCPGFKLHGAGFIVTPERARELGLGTVAGLENHIRAYRNGRDLTDKPRDVMVIDLFGLEADEVRARFPAVYQHVLERVKPERDANQRATYRDNWWIFGEPRRAFRPALADLPRYIATVETAKHRSFQFLDAQIAPDNKLICIALDDAFSLGVLSSTVHMRWALASGGWLGVGNDPVYVKTRCFDPFPFPAASEPQQARIRDLAEQLDAHRKRQQAAHPDLTL